VKGTARLMGSREVHRQAAVNTVINLQFHLKVPELLDLRGVSGR